MEIVDDDAISATEALAAMDGLGEEDLTESQQRAVEYLRKHVPVQDRDTFEELAEELADLDVFKDDQIVKIIETLPRTEQEVRTLFSKERIKLDDSDIDDVISFVESVEAA